MFLSSRCIRSLVCAALKRTEGIDEAQARICKQLRDTDFIARGVVKLEDAEPLASYYLTKLDPYIWHLCGEYKDLESFRSRSPTLTAAILTIAALHDSQRCHLYAICAKEFRRLVANAMFERKIDMEYLRALVIGSYWLSDISWTLSGYAIRRASEFNLKQYYMQIAESVRNPDQIDSEKLQYAIDGIRVLYLLYICDHHLSYIIWTVFDHARQRDLHYRLGVLPGVFAVHGLRPKSRRSNMLDVFDEPD